MKTQMKKSILTFVLLMSVTLASSQKMFNSTRGVGIKPYVPSKEFKQKVADFSKIQIAKNADDYNGFSDKDFFQLKNGFISLYSGGEPWYFRIIFDKKQNWVETHTYSHCDVQPEEEYYKFMPKMTAQINSKNYAVAECENYFKITNKKGFWY